MKITNKFGLPGAIVEAVKNDPYDPGDGDISVTAAIDPPLIRRLRKEHGNSITEDASDRWYSLLGQSVHAVLERAEPSALTEARLYMTVGETVLSGQFDRMTLRQTTLQDYKVMSTWEIIFGLKDEKHAQLNMLAELAIQNQYPIKNLEIVAMLRDWQMSKAKRDKDYPQKPIMRLRVPLWPQERRTAYIEARVALHTKADPQPCTDAERWYSGDKYAVMKKNRKSALRVLDTIDDATRWCASNNHAETYENAAVALSKGISIVHRPGEYRRCEDYCNVRAFCPMYA